jgi:hypothetical protein
VDVPRALGKARSAEKVATLMARTLHHRAANTYNGQWTGRSLRKTQGRRPFHCP